MSNKDAKNHPEEIEYIREKPKEAEDPAKPAEAADGAVVAEESPKAMNPDEENRHFKGKIKKREAEIKQLKKDKEEFKDQYLRALAEMENLKKRQDREKSEYTQFALSEYLLELLGVVDNFERALSTPDQDTDEKTFREGVELIYRMTQNILNKKGVQPIEINDKTFNPNLHYAMITEESDQVREPEVGQELQKGYMLHNRLLRPALVKVIVPKKS